MTCLKLNAKRNKNDTVVDHAYSSICFDLWLVLHKKFVNRSARSAKEYIVDVREVYSLSKEANIKSKKIMEQILAQITLDDVKTAILNIERFRNSKANLMLPPLIITTLTPIFLFIFFEKST